VRRAVSLLVAMVAVILQASCARDGGTPQSQRTQVEERQISSTARIVCIRDNGDAKEDAPNYSSTKENEKEAHNDGTLTRVLTPKVEAQPDGVHYRIDNRMGVDSSYTVEYPSGGGIGANLPKGESGHIEPFAPGIRIKISCDPPGYEGEKELELASFEIFKGDSGYRSRSLQCSGGGQLHGLPASGGNLKLLLPLPHVPEGVRQPLRRFLRRVWGVRYVGGRRVRLLSIFQDCTSRVLPGVRHAALVRVSRVGGDPPDRRKPRRAGAPTACSSLRL
jgi:hypothetical protein